MKKILFLLLISINCFSQSYITLDSGSNGTFKIENGYYPINSVIMNVRPDTNYVEFLYASNGTSLIRARAVNSIRNGRTGAPFLNRTELQSFYNLYMTRSKYKPSSNMDSSSYTTSLTMNIDLYDGYTITNQLGSLLFNAPVGNPSDLETIIINIASGSSVRTLSYNAAFIGTYPTSTVANKLLSIAFIYSKQNNKYNFLWSKTNP